MLNSKTIENEILEVILNTKKEIESIQIDGKSLVDSKKCAFLAFWDFDGTILKGDCSEGLKENNKELFKGLVELGILNGFAKEFKGEEGVAAFWKKYREMESIDKQEAYIFLPRIFAGNEESKIENFAKSHFDSILKNFYFPSSTRLLNELTQAGVESYIISASAMFFVKGAVGTTPIKSECTFGIEMKADNGNITDTVIQPVTYAEGKREKLKQIVERILKEKKADHVFILAGFGNSFHTDGPFLEYIAKQNLKVGKPISVMINGGDAPSEYKKMFKEVSFFLTD